MPIPTFDQFINPVLYILAQLPEGASARDVLEATAKPLGLTDSEQSEMLASGSEAIFKNRARWAYDRLKRAGLATSPRRGFWQLSALGAQLANSHPKGLPDQKIREIAFPPRPSDKSQKSVPSISVISSLSQSPDDLLDAAVREIRESVGIELLEMLSKVDPKYFESIVLDLLHKMGYGTNRSDLQRVGGSGDGGIDGIISLDRLGLEKVYVQAKRWQSSVGRPDVQGFYGALAGQRANKGVFITTSSFTQQAIDFAKSVEKIVLVDGIRLAELMIDFEVGVSSRLVRIPKLDSDYFEE